MVHVTVEVKFHNHNRGLDSMTISGDAPVVAEILRTVSGGDLPAHPSGHVVSVLCRDPGPATVGMRAYPIGDEWSGVNISRKSLYAAAEAFATKFGAKISEEP